MKSDKFINWDQISKHFGIEVNPQRIPAEISAEISIIRNYMRFAAHDIENLQNGRVKIENIKK